jgi:long-chain fatty acid transport protein
MSRGSCRVSDRSDDSRSEKQGAVTLSDKTFRLLACGFVIAIAAAWGDAARGQTYGIDFRNTLMPASGGMAGTSVATPQEFMSAINANPAAITHYRGTHFTIGEAFAEATVNLEQKTAAPFLGVTPFSAKSSTPGAIVPAISVAQEVEGLPVPTTVGLALLGAAGGGSSYVQMPSSRISRARDCGRP